MKDKICNQCGIKYDSSFRSSSTKYCSIKCRKEKRAEVQKTYREKAYEKLDMGSVEYLSKYKYDRYKTRSKRKGIDFNLTPNDFKAIFKEPCFYCGDKVEKLGFDRIDKDKGYNKENVVPCCKVCNMMKYTMSLNDFIERCKTIIIYQKSKS